MADVRTEMERLQDRGILRVTSFPVPFEGRKAARTIPHALARISGGYAPPDVILVIRGGSAAAGLASLADLALARAICRCRVPIVTGIVHASDRTILDDVAWRAAATPSERSRRSRPSFAGAASRPPTITARSAMMPRAGVRYSLSAVENARK